MNAGKLAFHGTPDALVTLGVGHSVGDSALERGYSAALTGARS
jgi:ABC-2 type transport system ATP-binding protein